MKPTIPYIEKKFDEFNQTIFRGRLPKLPIVLSDAATFLGKCECRRMTLSNGQIQYYDFLMRINTRFDLPEREIEDTIIHEMIHYFIFYHGLHDTSSHGEIFKAIMNSINTTHGRHITIRHNGDSSTAEQATSTRRTWHVIAAIYFKSGETGVKVLPRTVPKIIHYYNVAKSDPKVAEVKLFLHDNPFFNRYPTSAALRIHNIDKSSLESNLSKAHKLRVDGSRLIQE